MNQTDKTISFSDLFERYQPRPGVYDEASCEGELRNHFQTLVRHLNTLGVENLRQRWERAQRQINSDGVTVGARESTGNATRPWRLDAMPALLAEHEWNGISAGLVQRARLYEYILADLFSQRTLLRDRLLPPETLFANPGFCPAYHELNQPDQRYLQLFASDFARSPDGQWWATVDRTRAPYGLE